MPIEIWLAFVVASTVLLIIPGPTILTVISYSIAHGRRANAPLIAAVALGDSTALVVSLLGLGALLTTSGSLPYSLGRANYGTLSQRTTCMHICP
jgi:threonine/homoserine/homoserine lactone efflux protein